MKKWMSWTKSTVVYHLDDYFKEDYFRNKKSDLSAWEDNANPV